MPDTKGELRKAGHSGGPPPRRPGQRPTGLPVPGEYPTYFDSTGVLRCEYLTDLAEKLASTFGQDKLTRHQLRAFYAHVKRQEAALEAGRPFPEVYPEICKLKPIAAYRARRRYVPASFEEFISRNVDKVKDAKAFLQGFVEHFQAVVAYCAGTLKD